MAFIILEVTDCNVLEVESLGDDILIHHTHGSTLTEAIRGMPLLDEGQAWNLVMELLDCLSVEQIQKLKEPGCREAQRRVEKRKAQEAYRTGGAALRDFTAMRQSAG